MADRPQNQDTLDWYLKSWTDWGYQGWMVRCFAEKTGLTLSEALLFTTYLDATVQAKQLGELAPLQKKLLTQHLDHKCDCSDGDSWKPKEE